RDRRIVRVGIAHCAGLCLPGDGEGEVFVQVHAGQQRTRAVDQRAFVVEAADTGRLHDPVVVARVDFALVDAVAGFDVVPAVVPGDESEGPGELGDAGRRELIVDLHLVACSRRTVRPHLAGADYLDHVLHVQLRARPPGRHRGRFGRR